MSTGTDRVITAPEEIGVDNLLDFYIQEHEHFWKSADELAPNTTRPYWRASSLGKCLRAQCFERAGFKRQELSDQTRRTFQLGDDIHWFARKRWARMGLLLGEEIDISDTELSLSGHIDALVGGEVQPIPESFRLYRNPDWVLFIEYLRERVATLTGGQIPVRLEEIKSINSWSYRNLDGKVRSDHATQAAAYWILGERHPSSLPAVPSFAEVFYIEKDPMRFHRYRITPQWISEALGRLEELNAAWESGNWPRCTCGETEDMAWEAKYCVWPNEGGDGCCGQTLLDRLTASVEASR